MCSDARIAALKNADQNQPSNLMELGLKKNKNEWSAETGESKW